MRGEALAEHAETDHQVGVDEIGAALADARGDAPWQEFRIALDIGDEGVHLLGCIGQQPLLGMGRHFTVYASRFTETVRFFTVSQ